MTKILLGIAITFAIQAVLIVSSNKFYITVDHDETSLEFNDHRLELNHVERRISPSTTKYHN